MATAAAEPAARPSPPPRPAPAAPRDRGRERQGEREQAGGGGPVYLLRSEQPQVYLSWGSQMPRAPDRLKLRKVVDFWPVRLTLKADYETRTREFSYGLSCKVGAAGDVKGPGGRAGRRQACGLASPLLHALQVPCVQRAALA